MSKKIIKRINLLEIEDPSFLQNLSKAELIQLAKDIREFIIKNVARTGGHLSSNLGAVELEIALHYVFNKPNDKIIFDVGHQTYTHKILTGRAKDFETLRKLDGLSGYPSYEESSYDAWESGHSSTSISALEGYLIAKENGADIGSCVALIGDSAISSGIAFEALNNLGSHKYKTQPIIILNDNKMGISKSVGKFSKKLQSMHGNRALRGIKNGLKKISINPIRSMFHKLNRAFRSLFQNDNIFETFGYDYYGPYDGNNIKELIRDFKRAKKQKKPIVIHVITKKGKGYLPAENDNVGKYHTIGPFDLKTGEPLYKPTDGEYSYSEIVLDTLYKLRKESVFTIIDPAMVLGGDIEKFSKAYPNSIMDIGISEEHGASLAAGMSKAGCKAVILYYSTFLQRAYDEVLNDIARQNRDVLIGIDRAGVVGADGSTHQGIYDISMLQSMPNMKICMGMNGKETRSLIKYALKENGPIAVRYQKKNDFMNLENDIDDITETWTKVLDGNIGVCITYGPDVTRIKNLIIDNRLKITLINARFIRPMDYKMLEEIFETGRPIFIYEQVVKNGSLYEKIVEYKESHSKISKIFAIHIKEDTIIKHGDVNEVLDRYGLGDNDILRELKRLYEA